MRSEAWIFNALAAARKCLGDGPWSAIAEKCYLGMAAADFSGPESHALTRRKRATWFIMSLFRGK